MRKRFSIWVLAVALIASSAKAEVKLPGIFSDNMVLQREIAVKIWGWAKAGEKVNVSFNGQKVSAKTANDGKWLVTLNPMKAGGPFNMTISGSNTVELKNILIGDVWVCSGQSNMEFNMSQSINGAKDIAEANYPNIRLFYVPRMMSEKPLDNIKSNWNICTPQNAQYFSAVGFYFGLNLSKDLNVPIGLISSSWGGTLVEDWTSNEAMSKLPEYAASLESLKSSNIGYTMMNIDKLLADWNNSIKTNDPGLKEKWYEPGTDFSQWKTMKLPGAWEQQGLPNLDGSVWFETEFELTAEQTAAGLTLSLAKIDDGDQTFLNGKLVGETDNQYSALRNYKVKPEVLKEGKNILVVRAIDYGWGGGFWGSPDEMFAEANGAKIKLAGEWKYKIGFGETSPNAIMNPNQYATCLFNGMVSPLINYGIKGAIWYQGEANVRDAFRYRTLMANMINDWRSKWGEGDFPFLMVQLTNFEAKGTNDDGDWPTLRESQADVANKLPNVAMACIIDLGESFDIHPKNKHDVGFRLALAAQKMVYGKNVVASGPVFKTKTIEGNKAILTFDNLGGGWLVKNPYGYINGFAVAGADKEFHWAKAWLEGDKIVVSCDKVDVPLAVRYGWLNNPVDLNLFNTELLPAVPFRTDNW
jgi:sialate O-acetylesterase